MDTPQNFKEVAYDFVIPSTIYFNENIEPQAVKLYAIIRGLTSMLGYCFASNEYLAKIMGCHKKTISNWISSLEKEGYLDRETDKKAMHWQRKIYISDRFNKFLRRGLQTHPPPSVDGPPSVCGRTILEDKKKERKEDKEKSKTASADAYAISQALFSAIKKTMPKHKEPKFDVWALEIDVWLKADSPNIADIIKVLDWLPTNDFWKTNILSPKKLREKFLRLEVQMTTETKTFILSDMRDYAIKCKKDYPEIFKNITIIKDSVINKEKNGDSILFKSFSSLEAFKPAFAAFCGVKYKGESNV